MKVYRLALDILSPVHVGEARGRLSALEFFQDEQRVYLVGERLLASALVESGLEGEFIAYVEREGVASLDGFLRQLGPARGNALRRRIASRSVKKATGRLPSLQPIVTDPVSRYPYLPGSSLKGALRGAYLLLAAERDGQAFRRILARALQRKQKNPGEQVDGLLRATIRGGNRNLHGPHTDWLRCLHVSDAFSARGDFTEVREVRIASLNENGGYHFGANGSRLYVETIKPGSRLEATLRVDDGTLRLLQRETGQQPAPSLADLLTVITAKFARVMEAELLFLREAGLDDLAARQERLRQAGANLRVGWGSGLLSTSLLLAVSMDERRQLRDIYFKRRHHRSFPQSRKVVMDGNTPVATLGWVRMSLEEA